MNETTLNAARHIGVLCLSALLALNVNVACSASGPHSSRNGSGSDRSSEAAPSDAHFPMYTCFTNRANDLGFCFTLAAACNESRSGAMGRNGANDFTECTSQTEAYALFWREASGEKARMYPTESACQAFRDLAKKDQAKILVNCLPARSDSLEDIAHLDAAVHRAGMTYSELREHLSTLRLQYQRRCEAGHQVSCESLARIKDECAGDDYPRCVNQCSNGDGAICGKIGIFDLYGEGGRPKNPTLGALYILKACDASVLAACGQLGLLYVQGEGVIKNPATGAKYLDGSCKGGEMVSCSILGALYEQGLGVRKDLKRATSLYDQACGADVDGACERLKTLQNKGTRAGK